MVKVMSKANAMFPKISRLGLLSLLCLGLSSTSSLAQRSEQDDGSTPLISMGCSTSGTGELVTDAIEDVSVGKRIFTPAFHVNKTFAKLNPFLLTCKLVPSGQSKTLRLTAGIQDYAVDYEHEMLFTVYLDGEKTAYHSLSAGDGKTLLFDITKTSSIALEVTCSRSIGSAYAQELCPTFYFLKASILPAPLSSLSEPESTAFNNADDTNNGEASDRAVLEEESWGGSTVGKEENAPNNNPTTDIKDTIETVEGIINIFK